MIKNMQGTEEFKQIEKVLMGSEKTSPRSGDPDGIPKKNAWIVWTVDKDDLITGLEVYAEFKKELIESNGQLKQRLTVQISADILERAKNAVYWTRGLTLAQLTEQALEKVIASLEKGSTIYDDQTGEALKSKGDSFPERREELKSGRPVK